MKLLKLCTAALMAIFIIAMSGCGQEAGSGTEATPSPTFSTDTQDNQQTSSYLRPRGDLKNAIKQGETYNYLVWSVGDTSNPFEHETEVNRVGWTERKATLESNYGITINYVQPTTNWWQDACASAYAGNPSVDFMHCGGPLTVLPMYAYNGTEASVVLPLSDYAEYADFSDNNWWNQEIQESNTTFNSKLYFAVPQSTGIGQVSFNQIVLFNKELLERNGYPAETLYEWNENGEWTWDRFREVAIACTDTDNAIYGIAPAYQNALIWSLAASNGAAFITQVENGGTSYFEFTGNSNEMLEAWDFLVQLGKDGVLYRDQGFTADSETFLTGKTAMMTTYVNRTSQLVTSGDYPEYGILMPPKAPGAEDYVSDVNWFDPYCVFKGTANPEGTVQLLGDYCCPLYSLEDERNEAAFEAELLSLTSDEGSQWTLRNIASKSSPQSYFMFSNLTFPDGSNFINKITEQWITFVDGQQTPAAYFDSITDSVNSLLREAQGLK